MGSTGVYLLLDTCGEQASVALAQANGVLRAQLLLGPRAASAGLLQAIRSALKTGGLRLSEVDGIGVVNGPGSFTGVRAGLAVAKGLCEAAQLPMAAVSRLEVLAEAGPAGAVCALSAGRDEVYLRLLPMLELPPSVWCVTRMCRNSVKERWWWSIRPSLRSGLVKADPCSR